MAKLGGGVHKLEIDFLTVLAAEAYKERLRDG